MIARISFFMLFLLFTFSAAGQTVIPDQAHRYYAVPKQELAQLDTKLLSPDFTTYRTKDQGTTQKCLQGLLLFASLSWLYFRFSDMELYSEWSV